MGLRIHEPPVEVVQQLQLCANPRHWVWWPRCERLQIEGYREARSFSWLFVRFGHAWRYV